MFWSGQDAVSRSLELTARPERIISLVPSQTELLVDLGVGERLVGRTRYCIHPKERLLSVADVGGTKKVDGDRIAALKPDLILAEKEETPRELVELLSTLAPVYVTDVVSIPSAISMIKSVSKIVAQEKEGKELATAIEADMASVKGIVSSSERVLYLIWKNPWMAAGADTFINSCMEHLGFQNVALAHSARYPELSEAAIRELDPDRIFLSSEPYPFREKHLEELRAIHPNARIDLVDGELFSWYGSRMRKMPAYWRVFAK